MLDISMSTLERAIRRGEIKTRVVRRRVWISVSEVERYRRFFPARPEMDDRARVETTVSIDTPLSIDLAYAPEMARILDVARERVRRDR